MTNRLLDHWLVLVRCDDGRIEEYRLARRGYVVDSIRISWRPDTVVVSLDEDQILVHRAECPDPGPDNWLARARLVRAAAPLFFGAIRL